MKDPRDSGKPLVLATLFGGGWHREMSLMLEHFPAGTVRLAYVYGHCQGVHGAAELPTPRPGPRYPIHYLGPTRKHPVRFLTNTVRLLLSFVEALGLVRRLRPDAILAVGTAAAIPLFIAGRLFGARCVFVESLTRVEQMSTTGRILYHTRLADRLYVQWQRLQARFRRTTYAGAVL